MVKIVYMRKKTVTVNSVKLRSRRGMVKRERERERERE
jgi:hypothetical protein